MAAVMNEGFHWQWQRIFIVGIGTSTGNSVSIDGPFLKNITSDAHVDLLEGQGIRVVDHCCYW